MDISKLIEFPIDNNDVSKESYIYTLERRIITILEYTSRLENKNIELENEIIKLRNKLRLYENPHTPPSLNTIKKAKSISNNVTKSKKKKRGAPNGHKGATRKIAEPDEVIDVAADNCPKCGKDPGESYAKEIKIIEEIPPPSKIVVKHFNIQKYKCKNCGNDFKAVHKDCPKEGKFGPNLLAYFVMLKFFMRSPIRKVMDFLSHYENFDISSKGILDAINRVGKSCKIEYNKIKERIRNSKWVHIDETGMGVNGKNWWLWCFRSDSDDILIDIQDSRGSKVPKGILGEDWDNPTIVDGWSAYNWIKKVQRCWAHLLREVDEDKEKSDVTKSLSKEIHTKFKELKEFIDLDPSMDKREIQKKQWDDAMQDLVNRYYDKLEVLGKLKYIKNGLGKWYTCLLYPGMEPTNNLGEQAIRESVVLEKIIGTFRSEKGAEYYQYIASLLATWRFQHKNMFVELDKIIRKYLCLS